MAASYCYEGIPLRFLASIFDIQMRYLVYMRYRWLLHEKTSRDDYCFEGYDHTRSLSFRIISKSFRLCRHNLTKTTTNLVSGQMVSTSCNENISFSLDESKSAV